jgi:hypothetical protein
MAIERELIEPKPGDERDARRVPEGRFNKELGVGKSLSSDRRSEAKTKIKPGHGDRGDRRAP